MIPYWNVCGFLFTPVKYLFNVRGCMPPVLAINTPSVRGSIKVHWKVLWRLKMEEGGRFSSVTIDLHCKTLMLLLDSRCVYTLTRQCSELFPAKRLFLSCNLSNLIWLLDLFFRIEKFKNHDVYKNLSRAIEDAEKFYKSGRFSGNKNLKRRLNMLKTITLPLNFNSAVGGYLKSIL